MTSGALRGPAISSHELRILHLLWIMQSTCGIRHQATLADEFPTALYAPVVVWLAMILFFLKGMGAKVKTTNISVIVCKCPLLFCQAKHCWFYHYWQISLFICLFFIFYFVFVLLFFVVVDNHLMLKPVIEHLLINFDYNC